MTLKTNKKILFVRLSPSSFVQNDLKLLKKHFDVKEVDFILNRKDLKSTFKTIFGMIRGIIWADLTFSWFADLHAFWAVRMSKFFGKKSVVVVGGYEVVNLPEIEYGAMIDASSKSKVIYILENADKIITVSESSKNEIFNYIDSRNIDIVYNGVDCDKFNPSSKEKEDLVLTVSIVNNSNLKRKGLETFVKAAKYLKNINFVLIGKQVDDSVDYLKSIGSANVEYVDFLEDKELIEYYQRAKVYAQLSAHEAFGVAIAESMCCECIPVVTENAAIPEVVGNTGFYVPYDDPEATAKAINEALNCDRGYDARKRIVELFSISRREKLLIEKIKDVLKP